MQIDVFESKKAIKHGQKRLSGFLSFYLPLSIYAQKQYFNFHKLKQRSKSSFFSRQFFQEQVYFSRMNKA